MIKNSSWKALYS